MEKRILQIDVKGKLKNTTLMRCNLYFNGVCHTMYIPESEYKTLISEKFFIRDEKTKDSANVLNTTNVYEEQNYND